MRADTKEKLWNVSDFNRRNVEDIWNSQYADVFPTQEDMGAMLDIIKKEREISRFLQELYKTSNDIARAIDSFIGKRRVVLSPVQIEKGSKLRELDTPARTNLLKNELSLAHPCTDAGILTEDSANYESFCALKTAGEIVSHFYNECKGVRSATTHLLELDADPTDSQHRIRVTGLVENYYRARGGISVLIRNHPKHYTVLVQCLGGKFLGSIRKKFSEEEINTINQIVLLDTAKAERGWTEFGRFLQDKGKRATPPKPGKLFLGWWDTFLKSDGTNVSGAEPLSEDFREVGWDGESSFPSSSGASYASKLQNCSPDYWANLSEGIDSRTLASPPRSPQQRNLADSRDPPLPNSPSCKPSSKTGVVLTRTIKGKGAYSLNFSATSGGESFHFEGLKKKTPPHSSPALPSSLRPSTLRTG